MNIEVRRQYDALKQKLGKDKLFTSFVKIETTNVTYDHELIMHGVACMNEQQRVCLAHPQYLILSLIDMDYNCDDWTKLEQIVLYRLQYTPCVVNKSDKSIRLPNPTTQIQIQETIGVWPEEVRGHLLHCQISTKASHC